MNISDVVWVAVIGVIGALLGAIANSTATAFVANQKIRELQLTFQQNLQANYLSAARQYTNSIYVPMSKALTKLSNAYDDLRRDLDFASGQANPQSEVLFRAACQEYENTMAEFFNRGADAFLTSQLEERLRSFNRFLHASLTATQPNSKVLMQYRIGGFGIMPSLSQRVEFETRTRPLLSKILPNQSVSWDFIGVGFTYQENELLEAPITSREFEKRMLSDMSALKFLIKEVTLGKHASVEDF